MILVTGAAGKTGLAVIKALRNRGAVVRALVRRQEQAEELSKHGAADVVIADMSVPESYRRAMDGTDSVYHICPNMHPDETLIGRLVIDAASEIGLSHFVYHSVLHPHTEKMPHHWQKMRVEEMLFESPLSFTILQPAPYMQNILAIRDILKKERVYRVPYPLKTRLSMVDLEDLGEAAAVVLTEPGHHGAIYEIVGVWAPNQDRIAGLIGKALGVEITAEEIPLESWRKNAENSGLGQYQVETLLKMFDYYARFGLCGSNYLLKQLLGRNPQNLTNFIRREFI